MAADAIALAIEGHLREIEALGSSEMRAETRKAGAWVAFGRHEASGETYDIALVRLAGMLLELPEFKKGLILALRAPIDARRARVLASAAAI